MLPDTIQWYFPSKIKEAAQLIRKQGNILHAGGTKILEPQPRSSIKGLVDIGGLGLNYVKVTGKSVHIGAGATFADVVAFSRQKGKLRILGESLSHAASTPLRNRITVGGSIKDFPMWSNLYAPLLALDAKVEILGERSGIFSLEEYAGSGLIRSKHLVKEVRVVEREDVAYGVKTFHVVRFEYPIFTLAAAFTIRKHAISDVRLFITGVQKKYARLEAAEKIFRGEPLTEEIIDSATRRLSLKFVPDFRFTAQYKERVARVYFKDLIHAIQKSSA